jgi:CubicO group peptidase (beta-lactamase class C family)
MRTRRPRNVATLFLTLAVLVPAQVGAQYFAPDEGIEIMLRYLVEDGETPGVLLGLLEADGSIRILGYGSPGPDARPMGPLSVFEIGSINKTFTGALLADMVAKGEVALDDPVAKYLPSHVTVPSYEGREIMLLDLATHTSGLPRLPDNHQPADMQDPYADYTIEKMYAFLSGHELRRRPETEYEYSNLGMGVLGHALARAAGSSYTELLGERILEPLGMGMTGYALEGELADWMTRGHDNGVVVPYWFATEAIQGAGGLRSNLEDMLTYLQANVGVPDGELERAMRDAHQVRRSMGADAQRIGLGWHVLEYQGRDLVGHGGGTGGFSTYIGFDPELGVGFVRLANTTGFRDDIGLDFLRRGPPLDISEVEVAREILEGFVGVYELAPGRRVFVRMEDEGWLTVQLPPNVRFRMYAASDSGFFLKRTPWQFTFTRDETGTVTGVEADLEGTALSGRKVAAEIPSPKFLAGNESLPVTADDIARYEGAYTLQAGQRTMDMEIFGRNGVLMTQLTGQQAYELLRVGDHEFALAVDANVRLSFSVEEDRAVSVTLNQRGQVITGERKR